MKWTGEVVGTEVRGAYMKTLRIILAGVEDDPGVMEIVVPYRNANAYSVGRRVILQVTPVGAAR